LDTVLKYNDKLELGYIRQLDGLRCCSILSVFVFHFISGGNTDRIPFGYGVIFFFVLSSFLITRILLSSKLYNEKHNLSHFFSLKQFYLRRSLRIFPIYYLFIAALFIINWKPVKTIIVYLLTYTTNFIVGLGWDTGNFVHLWSLAIEEQFYIVFPFIIFFVPNRYLITVLCSLVVIGLGFRALVIIYDPTLFVVSNFHSISCLDSLGIGAILGYLSIMRPQFLRQIISNRLFFAASVIAFVTSMLFFFTLLPADKRLNFGNLVFMRFTFSVMSFWILGWAVVVGYSGLIRVFLENRFIAYLGRISYGLYLYHLFVPSFVGILCVRLGIKFIQGEDGIAQWSRAAIYTAVCITVATASWYVLEKPIGNLKKYLNYSKHRAPSAALK
jgi:peptidoglycan/LPS O-acetylase OafA/YrhL